MDFVLWACRVMHSVSVVVWVGGLIFLNSVVLPILEFHRLAGHEAALAVQKRSLAFFWSSTWTLLTTGLLLMLLSPRFLWFDYSTAWSQLLALKQLLFLLMVFFSWQATQVFRKMEATVGREPEWFERWRLTFARLVRRSVAFAILALLASAGMMVL